jgi:hypothetical protein
VLLVDRLDGNLVDPHVGIELGRVLALRRLTRRRNDRSLTLRGFALTKRKRFHSDVILGRQVCLFSAGSREHFAMGAAPSWAGPAGQLVGATSVAVRWSP